MSLVDLIHYPFCRGCIYLFSSPFPASIVNNGHTLMLEPQGKDVRIKTWLNKVIMSRGESHLNHYFFHSLLEESRAGSFSKKSEVKL
jgi:hypothetical protein